MSKKLSLLSGSHVLTMGEHPDE